jgi:zinc/manganese transport system ATP-binding protein
MTYEHTSSGQSTLLDVRAISVALGGQSVLDDVNFRVDPGEFTALIGTNGAGKTTLLRVILGLQRPDTGTVFIDGEPLARRHRSVGYVPQRIVFDPEMPVRARDLVALGIDGQRLGWVRRSRRRDDEVEAMLDAVDAASFADRKMGVLSGGEQQRILVAHALVSRPRLLLLDEPLANLDPGSSQEIIDLLHQLSVVQRVAILLTSHEMNPLLPVIDRLVYIANGRVASGTVDEVVRPDVLTELYGHHVDVVRIHGRVLVVTNPAGAAGVDVADHPELIVE